MNEPIGFFGSFKPTLVLLIALTNLSIALSWPITFSDNVSVIPNNLELSFSSILSTGMPVIIATTSDIFFSLTLCLFFLDSSIHFFFWISNSANNFFSVSLNCAASSYFWFWTTWFFWLFISSILFSISIITSGTSKLCICTLDPASSIKSIALSGRNLSLINLSDNFTQASIACGEYMTLWWFSYLSLIFSRIFWVSSGVVGSTTTTWNLLASAPSFSTYCLYSSSVVAPIHWSSPLAKAGLNIFEASNDPEAPPAPTIVCNSSINKIISSDFSISVIIAFILSSNWPLYFVPATRDARSKVTTLLLWRIRETFFCVILKAKASAIAVFPTPGSPIKIGLFFFLLVKIWATLSISFSLPITGSNLSSWANFVKSLPKLSRIGVFDFSFVLVALVEVGSPLIFEISSPSRGSDDVVPWGLLVWYSNNSLTTS